MAVFTDTVTLYKKTVINDATTWVRYLLEDVQWSDKTIKTNDNGKVSLARYTNISIPDRYKDLFNTFTEAGDLIIYGNVSDEVADVKGSRPSDMIKKYPKSGLIKEVNDNTNRDYLKHIKVVLA